MAAFTVMTPRGPVQGELDLTACADAPTPTPRGPAPDVQGNVLGGLGGLLSSLGLVPVRERDEVADVVRKELGARGLEASVVRLQHGTLVLSAAPQVARLLSYELDALGRALAAQVPGQVERVRVQVAR